MFYCTYNFAKISPERKNNNVYSISSLFFLMYTCKSLLSAEITIPGEDHVDWREKPSEDLD